jgi:hypothetical protein
MRSGRTSFSLFTNGDHLYMHSLDGRNIFLTQNYDGHQKNETNILDITHGIRDAHYKNLTN